MEQNVEPINKPTQLCQLIYDKGGKTTQWRKDSFFIWRTGKTIALTIHLPSGHVWLWELTVNKAEHQRINAFPLWCLRRLMKVPWTARRPNQSILRQISLEYSLEGLMIKLKLQYFGHLMQTHWKSLWCWERLRAEEEGVRRWDGWMASWIQWT